jgi:prepilin-type N-terminal cleavage/methylation domain-containing protein
MRTAARLSSADKKSVNNRARPVIVRSSRAVRRDGFTLLEVVLAVGIFSIAVVTFAATIDAGLDANRAQSREIAIRLALETLAVRARAERLQPGRASYPEDPQWKVKYEREIKPLRFVGDDGKSLNHLYEVHLIASYVEGGRPLKLDATFYIYQPPGP